MIVEHALLNVIPAKTTEFEVAIQKALPLISQSTGFHGLEIRRNANAPAQYLLLVHWD